MQYLLKYIILLMPCIQKKKTFGLTYTALSAYISCIFLVIEMLTFIKSGGIFVMTEKKKKN